MFLRINTSGKNKYIKILHNYRDGKKSKHKAIMQLGRYNKERYEILKKELKDWKRISRAATIINEIENDVANVKKHAKPFVKKLNYK
jgi:hypothetical protein